MVEQYSYVIRPSPKLGRRPTYEHCSMSSKTAKAITAALLVVNCILWAQSRRGFVPTSYEALLSLNKRSITSNFTPIECAPHSYPLDQQCAHVREHCPETDTVLGLPHLEVYFCSTPPTQPLVFVGLLVWLALLFSSLGIGASDFFCPNLATISNVLGLDENVAGVTLLALGNGSPDVFSTFSAMRTNSGSLAVGELLGAASFIVTVVVGSMCVIKPFYVHRGPFLRDVGFFTAAVLLMLWILHDGVFQGWEAGLLVGLYVTYVVIVIIATWWDKRRERRRQANLTIRSEYRDESPPQIDFEPYRDDPNSRSQLTLTIPSNNVRGRALSNPNPLRSPLQLPPRPRSRSPPVPPLASPRRSASSQHLPSFSLLTALEFRDVVASLRNQSNTLSLTAFDGPLTPFAGRLYKTPSTRSRSHRTSEIDPWDEALGRQMRLDRFSPEPSPHRDHTSESFMETLATPISSIAEGVPTPITRWQLIKRRVQPYFHTLFPHLQNISKKSVLSVLVAIFATPGVLALTITLPVVITSYENPSECPAANDTMNGRLVDFEEEGVERVLVAEDELKEDLDEGTYHKWLTAVQCILGPLFCMSIIIGFGRSTLWYFLAATIVGISVAVLVTVFSDDGNNVTGRTFRCSMGFFIAVIWIMAIADEVVSVLKAFGLIFGFSDAIIGLTVFAIGNSLADLVANTSVAAFAPIMGFSACFGGPMMNILLGIGVSGSIVIEETGKPYNLHFSRTLLVSAIGLLFVLCCTLIFVPWNGYFLSRKWGIFLIACYVILMAVNIIVEARLEQNFHI